MASFEAAHEKLMTEMKGHENNPTYEKVLDHLMLQAEDNILADLIMNKEKTISGAIAQMTNIARKKATGGSYVMTDDEGLKIIDEYYEFGAQALAEKEEKPSFKGLNIDLDDL